MPRRRVVPRPEPARDPSLLSGPELEEACLAGWHTLNPMLMGLDRHQVAYLLKAELFGRQRPRILERLHQRLATLRQQAEWEQLLEAVAAVTRAPANARSGEVEKQVMHRFGSLSWLVTKLSP